MQDRIFTTKDEDGEDLVLRFKRPSQTILSKAELVYRTAFSKAFRQDIITDAEVGKLLRDRGLWTEKEQSAVDGLREEIIDLEEKLKNPGLSDEEGEVICKDIEGKRIEVISASLLYQNLADNTCEAMAREEQNKFLCVECVVDNKTGERVYKDIDEFKARMDELMAVDAFQETVIAALEIQTGRQLSSNPTDEYAENKWRAERKAKAEKAEEKPKKAKTKKKTKKSS